MKTIFTNYEIQANGSIRLNGLNVPISQILLISNVSTGTVIYSVAGPAATSYSQGTPYSTIFTAVAPATGDKLAIFYDDASSTQPVSGTFWQTTQPVSGPLTDAQLRNSAVPVSVGNFPATQPISGTVGISGTVPVSGTFYQATQPVSAASLPLPSGAAQDGTDASSVNAPTGGSGIRGWLSGIYQKLSNTLTVSISGTPSVSVNNASLAVTGTFYQATQPISGTVTANAGTNLNTSALALESGGNLAAINTATGAANAAYYSDATGAASGGVIALLKGLFVALKGTLTVGTHAVSQSGTWTVGVSGTVPVSGTFYQTTQPVSASTLPLPSGAATEAGNLATIATNTSPGTAINGQALATGSGVLGWLSNIYKAVSGTLTVSGTVTANVAGGNATAVKVDGSAVTQPVSGTFWQTTQPVSGTVTANVAGGNTTAVKVDGSAVTQPVSGPLTDTQLRASPVPTSLASLPALPTGTNTIGNVNVLGGNSTAVKVDNSAVTQPVSIAALPALATGTNTIGSVNLAGGPISQTTVSVGTASTAILGAGLATKMLVVQNLSTSATVYFGKGTAALNTGIALGPGQGYEFPFTPSDALNAIGTATAAVSVTYA